MSIGRILAIRIKPSASPATRTQYITYEALMRTSVGKAQSANRSRHRTPVVYRHGNFIYAYPGMLLQIKDCVGPLLHFVVTIQCGSVVMDVGGDYWAQIRGAEDIAVTREFPIVTPGLSHAGPKVEDVAGRRSVSAYTVNPSR